VEIRNLIRELGKDRTVILSTHNLPEVMATCNRMLIIHDGRLVADGTPEELQRREVDNPLVRVVVTGAGADDVQTALTTLQGTEAITEAMTVVPDAVAFDVRCVAGEDARTSIFRMVAERGWDLVELHREVLDLEGIFRKLTQVV
jgi:ABC-2 type transport system ATP-binding protein